VEIWRWKWADHWLNERAFWRLYRPITQAADDKYCREIRALQHTKEPRSKIPACIHTYIDVIKTKLIYLLPSFIHPLLYVATLPLRPSFFLKPQHKAVVRMKNPHPKGRIAIKNSPAQDPEGYWSVLEAARCNAALAPRSTDS